jgi:hypothetical protein
MTTPTKFSSADLLVLHRHIAEWRHAQSGRPRLPPGIWDAAAALALRHRPSAVARTLGLSYPKLRQWMSQSQPPSLVGPEPARFVELKWGPAKDAPPEPLAWAELRDPSGRMLRLQVGNDPHVLVALADSFWRQGR